MISFIDGPKEVSGHQLSLHHAPLLLRVVVGPRGKLDALDGPFDSPEPVERIHVYRAVNVPTYYHIRAAKRSASGWYATCSYSVLSPVDHPPDSITRHAGAWKEWCRRYIPLLVARDIIDAVEAMRRKARS